MSPSAASTIVQHIRQHGPITFAQFMEFALYDPEVGYYANAAKRSGRGGDFYTSVDVGPVFGTLLAEAFAQMFDALDSRGANRSEHLDLVEVAAGNGRLSRDVLNALERVAPGVYERVRLHLVERSAAARAEHVEILGRHAARLASSLPGLGSPPPGPTSSSEGDTAYNIALGGASEHGPGDRWRGILFANELLDALPTHVVVGVPEGLREIYVDADGDDGLVERAGPLSTPAIAQYLERVDAVLQPGWRAEVNLGAIEWVRQAARALDAGFLVLVDYGHEASTLYSESHAAGTLATFTSHVVEVHEPGRPQPWLRDPGKTDITAHVDFTTIRRTAQDEGLQVTAVLDQARFLTALGRVDRVLAGCAGNDRESVATRLAVKTLLLPGGIGSTHHVVLLSKGVDATRLGGRLANSPVERIK